jgi:hypothetical protein
MECSARTAESINIQFARCFLRLANLDNGAFERLVGTKARYGGKLAGSPLRCGSGIAVVSYGSKSKAYNFYAPARSQGFGRPEP